MAELPWWRLVSFLNSVLLYSMCLDQLQQHLAVDAYLAATDVPYTWKGEDDTDTYFGFSLSFHTYGNQSGLLVGAPKASSVFADRSVTKSGALLECPFQIESTEGCQEVSVDSSANDRLADGRLKEEKSNMWLGSAVMSAGPDQRVLVCARAYQQIWRWPRLADSSGDTDIYDDVGRCYLLPSQLDDEQSIQTIQACHYFSNNVEKGPGKYWLSQCGVGDRIDAIQLRTEEAQPSDSNQTAQSIEHYQFAIGGPSQLIGRGQTFLVEYNTSADGNADVRTTGFPHTENFIDTYMGYGLTQGDIDGDGTVELVSSRPREYEGGCVWILVGEADYKRFHSTHFNPANLLIIIRSREEVGEYFGYSMALADVNGDGLSDLIVGAPLYSTADSHGEHKRQYDAGHVYIFGGEQLAELIAQRHASSAISKLRAAEGDGGHIVGQGRSWFGATVVSMGDMDRDGYEDIAIGAPFEEIAGGSTGAVYLHFGSAAGLQLTAKQKLTPESVAHHTAAMHGFGFSISRRWDIDANGFNDLAIGAPLSSVATVFRSRPAIVVTMHIIVPRHPANEHTYCDAAQLTNVLCTKVSVCASYTNIGADVEAEIRYVAKVNGSLLFSTDSLILSTSAGGTLKLAEQFPARKCFGHILILPALRSPCLHTTVSVSEWHLVDHRSTRANLSPVLKQNTHKLPTPAVVEFVRPCNGCQPDLRLQRLRLEPGTSQRPIVLGREKRLLLKFEVANQNTHRADISGACGAKFKLSLPAGLTFKYVLQGHIRACSADVDAGSASCHIRPIIPPGTTETFEIQLNVDKALSNSLERYLSVGVLVRSENEFRNLEDNLQELREQVSREASLSISGTSYQRQVELSGHDGNTEQSADIGSADRGSSIGPLVGHEYLIYNEGPSPIPKSSIKLNWPLMIDAGSQLLHLMDIQSNMKSLVCNHSSLVDPLWETAESGNGVGNESYSLNALPRSDSQNEAPRECISRGGLCHVTVHCTVPAMAGKTASIILASWRVNTQLSKLVRKGRSYH
eukprot:scpid13516/ scgid3686/ Integrin alpha-8; Integrin alpha-8 heavy chain; Integrin alpha-8 light chain